MIFFLLMIYASIGYACEYADAVQKLLPSYEYVTICEYLPGGQSNNVVLCKTQLDHWYVFRYYKNLKTKEDFIRVLNITQKAADLSIHPRIIGSNDDLQQVLMDYIPGSLWPTYERNKQPYKAAMTILRMLHDALPASAINDYPRAAAPFLSVILNAEILHDQPGLPRQLWQAFKIVNQFHESMLPWLDKHAVLCHGDFKRSNVLLQRNRVSYHPWIIDFDSAAIGHPYYDVVKFSRKLTPAQRTELFEEYLGHAPTAVETLHFNIIDSVVRMVIAIIRFKLVIALQKLNPVEESFSQEELEALLDIPDPLPLQATVPLKDACIKEQQLGAVYALHEFLQCSVSLLEQTDLLIN